MMDLLGKPSVFRYEEEFEDTKGVIRICISKNKQHNGQKRRTNNTMAKREEHNTMAKREEQTTQWPKEKNKQHNDQKRRTNNTMTKRKKDKGRNYDQNIHIKLKIE